MSYSAMYPIQVHAKQSLGFGALLCLCIKLQLANRRRDQMRRSESEARDSDG